MEKAAVTAGRAGEHQSLWQRPAHADHELLPLSERNEREEEMGHGGARGALGELDHEGLVRAQAETEQSPRRGYSVAARLLFGLLDAIYGRGRTLSKFKVLELVARVPYQAWEQVAYVAMTHTSRAPGFARRIFDRVRESRQQQDNEQWHLLILEDLIAQRELREGFV